MLLSKNFCAPSLLRPATLATAVPTSFALLRRITSHAKKGASYAEWKNITGDPGKEWLSGSCKDGAGVTQKLHLGKEELLEGAKRGAEEMTEVSKEAMEARLKGAERLPAKAEKLLSAIAKEG